mgnify:CR=1 FL=1
MPGLPVGRCGVDVVGGGPLLTPPKPSRVFVNGMPIATVGTKITPHGPSVHAASVMSMGSPTVSAGGLPVCAHTHLATCGHTLIAASNVFVGK